MIYTDSCDYKIVSDTHDPLLRCFFLFRSHNLGIYNYLTLYKLSEFGKPTIDADVEIFSQSFNIDLRNASTERIPVVYVGITQLPLMFKKHYNFHFHRKGHYKIIASRGVEIRFSRGIGLKTERGFRELAQTIGRTKISFLRKYLVLIAKLIRWNLLCEILH